MQLVTMKVKDVRANDDNPPERTDRNNKFKNLMKSVSKVGLMSPIVISSDNRLINGTRRLAVHKDLGKKNVFKSRNNWWKSMSSENGGVKEVSSKFCYWINHVQKLYWKHE